MPYSGASLREIAAAYLSEPALLEMHTSLARESYALPTSLVNVD